jgi:SAM-dependent methyltransferase
MKFQDFLKQEQKIVNQNLTLKHGYELIWMGSDLISGSRASPIKRQIKMGFFQEDCLGPFPVDCLVEPDALPFEENAIDFVILSHVLEFEKNPQVLLKEIYRVLRPDGALLITGFSRLWGHWARRFLREMFPGYFFKNQNRVLYFRSARQLIKLAQSGVNLCFERKKHEKFGFCINAAWMPKFSRGYALLLEKQTIKLREIRVNQEDRRPSILTPIFGGEGVDPKPCPQRQGIDQVAKKLRD